MKYDDIKIIIIRRVGIKLIKKLIIVFVKLIIMNIYLIILNVNHLYIYSN